MAETSVVCGGGGALGGAIVEALLTRGDEVIVVDRHADGEPVERLRREAVDLTAPEAVEELWARLAADGVAPRWVVNAVGGFRGGRVSETEPDALHFVEDLNLGTAWWSCRSAALHLPEGGAIVNVSSRSGVSGGAGSAAYSVSKAGVNRLTEVLAAELAERHVRVNAVMPSVIDTPANRESLSAKALEQAVAPADIASVIAFLLSEASVAITGAVIPVYGHA
jgi:NAD(P)-dependent dehydrogenase (short-subunit alcohol dehydrogenase family)